MRRHLELAIEGAQLGVWSYNPHTGSCWFSDRSKELWGLADNLIPDARELQKVVHPEDRDAQLEPFFDRFPDEPAGIEYRIVRPDGETRWIYALGAAARDEDGESAGGARHPSRHHRPQAGRGRSRPDAPASRAGDRRRPARRLVLRSARRILLVLRPVEGPARP